MAKGDNQLAHEANGSKKWSELLCPFMSSSLLNYFCDGSKCALFCVVHAEYGNGVWSGCAFKALAKQSVGSRLT